ncbi:TIGR03013 family XrtA/PEP-CTERM system glycosyltransferase [Congregibacter litoralis]|uniref:Sugar transferase n=1 Tax=Congregibacter litoralis KT71 TaxID=314285 RepID=A4A523_9GAMM|nr:TIGR03013 family XrtA/PEP-CTERM system glycosyltransferase [Congregibacter litoralis]EAQ98894.1 sugar transferase [Congregibacter litoralis KT71]
MTGLVGTVRIFNHHINVGYYWLALIDLMLFGAAIYAGAALYFIGLPGGFSSQINNLPLQAVIFAVVTTLAMFSMGLYEPKLREGVNGILLRTAGAFGLMTVAMSLIFYVMPDLHIWRGNFALAAAIALVAALINRLLWTRFIDLEQFKRRVLVLGTGPTAATISQKMRRKADRRGFRIVGFVRQVGEESVVEGEPTLALDCPISEYVRRNDIEEVVVALEDRRDNMPKEDLLRCRGMGVRVLDIVDFFEQEAGKVLIRQAHSSWFTFGAGFQRADAGNIAKRLFDVTMSFLLLMIAWPFMLLTVFAIWLEDGFGAPILYKQKRVGLNGRIYEVIKFRSMTVNAEGDGKARWATSNDARVTRVGKCIRKTRIDELPQIINVMAGDMAFVGPRPERPEFVRELNETVPFYEKRHCVKPGITGWAQMNYPYGASLEDTFNKLEFDLYYVKNRSLFLDFLVLLQTAEVILFGKGAR